MYSDNFEGFERYLREQTRENNGPATFEDMKRMTFRQAWGVMKIFEGYENIPGQPPASPDPQKWDSLIPVEKWRAENK